MEIRRHSTEHLDITTLRRGELREHYVTAHTEPGDNVSVFRDFPPEDVSVVSQLVFGGVGFHDEAVALMGDVDWPITWVHGDGCSGESLAGTQAFGVSGVEVRPVVLRGQVVGRLWEDEDGRYLHLGGVLPEDVGRGRPEQARSLLESLEAALGEAGMDFSNVVRTWLYIERILEWYGDFNKVRNTFFEERGIFEGLVPASTGIGAANPAGAAVVGAALAIEPRGGRVKAASVPSPLQRPAMDYRSAFSRAVEVSAPGRRYLYVSGTASIDAEGRTVHEGDVDAQIDRTMRVVGAILESRGMDWSDTTRMVAYFKDFAYEPRYHAWMKAHEMPVLPVSRAHAAVCRPDLLFEIELDALAVG
jgi:enamine deaminase RidA (YjgF/YER057c/UK114 family)